MKHSFYTGYTGSMYYQLCRYKMYSPGENEKYGCGLESMDKLFIYFYYLYTDGFRIQISNINSGILLFNNYIMTYKVKSQSICIIKKNFSKYYLVVYLCVRNLKIVLQTKKNENCYRFV